MPFRKILALKLRSMGDTILMTSPIEQLARAFPNAEIHVAVTSDWAPLLEGNPSVSKIWRYERRPDRASRAKALAKLALKLRAERFDCVANFHASPSSALLSFATGAKTRSIHFHGHRDKNRYSTVLVPGKGTLKPIIERDMDTVRALGVNAPMGTLPRVYLTESEKAGANEKLKSMGLQGPILGIGLGASRPTKTWSVERYADLAMRWCDETAGSVLVPTGPLEAEALRIFQAKVSSSPARGRISVLDRPEIRELAALQSQISVFAGNDSGPRHLAVAVGIPTVTLFGPEHPFEWHPYPQDRHPRFFIESLSCRRDALPGKPPWCGLNICVAESHRCMTGHELSSVLEACKKLVSG